MKLICLLLLFSSYSFAESCQISNQALEAMTDVQVNFESDAQKSLSFVAKYANNNQTRAAGFQHICESTIDSTLILFEFKKPTNAIFHMRNVLAPLDIAFIGKKGSIDSIQTMQPYSMVVIDKPLYKSESAVIAALEAHQGFFAEHGIDQTTKVTWSTLSKDYKQQQESSD